jgi:pyroglutamyl-peptidase
MKIVVTGFGPFGDVKENPSSLNLECFPETESLTVIKNLAVSIKSVDSFIEKTTDNTVYIHFGVNMKGTCIQIERFAYNEMLFAIPDADGIEINTSRCISAVFPLAHALETAIPIHLIQQKLDGPLSEDPGRYICNYLYFKSLHATKGRSLFVHVPSYDVVSQQEQENFIRKLISAIYSCED